MIVCVSRTPRVNDCVCLPHAASERLIDSVSVSQPQCMMVDGDPAKVVVLPSPSAVAEAYNAWRRQFVDRQAHNHDASLAATGVILTAVDMIQA